MNFKEALKSQITEIFSANNHDSTIECIEELERISKNRMLDEKTKLAFNRNFYSYLRDIEVVHGDMLVNETAGGIAYLASRSFEEREQMNILGDEYKFSFKLLDGDEVKGFYPAWNPETGKCKLPFQFLFFIRIVALNDYDKSWAASKK